MINYRVANLEALVIELKKEGVLLCDTLETVEYGKFVHLLDMEGNKIELFPMISNTKSWGGRWVV